MENINSGVITYGWNSGTDKEIEYHYNHFNLRLQERYDMSISRSEFDLLHDYPFDRLYKISCGRSFGQITIKERRVWVIKDKRVKCMVTCLDEGGTVPTPYYCKDNGVSTEKFSVDLMLAISTIRILRKQFDDHGDKKRFFTERNPDVPFWMYSLAYGLGRIDIIEAVVRNLYNPNMEQQMSITERNRLIRRNKYICSSYVGDSL